MYSTSRISKIIFAVLGVIAVVLLLVLISSIKNLFSPSFKINLSSQSVVTQIQSLDRLETTSFTIEKVIDGGTNYNAVQQFLVGDKILLIAHGTVIAGFDLKSLTTKDVTVTGQDVEVRLPAPVILTTTLDNNQTRVYNRQQGLLNHGDANLESNVRQAAEKSIHDAACQEGILNTAAENGRKQFTGLLKAFGFQSITIVIPNGSC